MNFIPPIFKGPRKEWPEWADLPLDDALDLLKRHLQTAMLIELYTIPMYLYAAYSIKDNQRATWMMINVIKQEMLHLGLSGNVLCSIGGNPRVFGDNITPTYPAQIFDRGVELNLAPATTQTLLTFAQAIVISDDTRPQVEQPDMHPHSEHGRRRLESLFQLAKLRVPDMEAELIPNYDSIGDFYAYIKEGITIVFERMNKLRQNLFLPNTFSRQFNTDDGSWADGNMTVISDLPVALVAFDVIIEQGEGASSEGDNIPTGIHSHYEVFRELLKESGEGEVTCWDVVTNIDSSNYTDEAFYGLMVACDAAYSYLLMTIELMWKYSGKWRGRLVTNNMMNLMLHVLRPMAVFLTAQEITSGPNKGRHAGPPFRQYNFQGGKDGALAELKQLTQAGLAPYPDQEALERVQAAVDALIDLANVNLAA
ncbi:hypothetical protein FRB99_002988 [Tulasnella sp. 403]|nr:hypothetical protein FRB99_002988 [Tulasnella sp. 403]